MQAAKACPQGCEIWSFFGSLRHDFTIQLGTELTKRAATMVLPGWYCTATTEASVSSEPSELRSRRMSANSSGVAQANRTSREVPNSMTVLSCTAVLSGWLLLLALLWRVN